MSAVVTGQEEQCKAEGTESQVLRQESPWVFEAQQEGRAAGKQ